MIEKKKRKMTEQTKTRDAYIHHTLVHHACELLLSTHPFMIVRQIKVALVVEAELTLRK